MDIVINSTCSQRQGGLTPSHGNYYQNILTCLGYSVEKPPVAELLRRYHKLEGHWLIASPIHWQATHNDAMIMACDDALDLSDNESRRWFAALAGFLVHDQVKLHYHDAYTWLIQYAESPSIHAKPVHMLLQQPMMQHLQALDSSLFWSKFLTENQMFFSEHPLNKARTGLYPINGVWIWGDGDLRPRTSKPMVSSDEATHDLAVLLSTQVRRYVPDLKLPKDAVLLFSEFDEQQAASTAVPTNFCVGPRPNLRARFEKNVVHWYWNNADYITKPNSWFACISRILKRA